MNELCDELVERIRGEVPDLERVAQRALHAWSRAHGAPAEQADLDSVW